MCLIRESDEFKHFPNQNPIHQHMKNLLFILAIGTSLIVLACSSSNSNTTDRPAITPVAKKMEAPQDKTPNAELKNETPEEPEAKITEKSPPQVKSVKNEKLIKKEEPKKQIEKEKPNAPTKTSAIQPPKEEQKNPRKVDPATDNESPTEIKTELDPPQENSTINKEIKPKEKPAGKEPKIAPATPIALSHDDWNGLLQKNVSSSGKVNYKAFRADLQKLDAYLKLLADNPVQSNWSRNKKMAYWINAYNAFTVKLIVDNYPLSSITNLDGGKPWDVKWIQLGAKSYSLNNIENDILRPKYKDARIHFAVNCAAQSCPPLLNKAWTEANLNQYFEQQAKKFINNPKFNTITEKKVEVSKIFEWYAEDFGNLIDYLNKYSDTKIKSNAKISFREYDWKLNE